MSGGVTRFSVSVNPVLLEEFDEVTEGLGYSRSNAIQVAMRGFLAEHKLNLEPEADVVGAIVMVYDHHQVRGHGSLTHTQHHYMDVITSTTHVHLDEVNCLETVTVKGKVKDIRDLANELMTARGVKQLRTTILSTK
jgi:CopG family nickel-responsive transcriptional regulator